MRRSLYKQGVRHPLNLENSEFLHSLGRRQTCLFPTQSGHNLELSRCCLTRRCSEPEKVAADLER